MLTIENVIQNPVLFAVKGDVSLHESPSKAGLPAAPPVNIIQTDQTLEVRFDWAQSGFLSNLISEKCKWELSVYLEQMGIGEVGPVPSRFINFVIGAGKTYNESIFISSPKEGVYKVVACLQLHGPNGNPTPVAAIEDLGILKVYND